MDDLSSVDALSELEASPLSYAALCLPRALLVTRLEELEEISELPLLKLLLQRWLPDLELSAETLDASETDPAELISLRRDVLASELQQVGDAQTLDRARYYLRRLKHGVQETRTSPINEINLLRWKEYDEILTDSLWMAERRDTAREHLGWYWGNFIPLIPRQMMLRYTRRGDWVLDPFLGSGTTLIECRRMGRHGLGIELNPEIARRTAEILPRIAAPEPVATPIVVGDNRSVDLAHVLAEHQVREVQLLLLHPPYHDIIKFSDQAEDLSNAPDVDAFLAMFGQTLDHVTPLLARGRYAALVIGDKYVRSEWVPLGFACMQEVLKRGFMLKSIVVKNFEETRGKRAQKELWRYRALAGGFYVFKHEYIFLFKKR